eukprot:TRINITY_DN61076_c0_g1_i1.p1 TRINITY_DN61076_c0_g1~~TRINITY_DN61076_c0_g1_i1.p1  ORF type:complete len:611 (+),score=125.92 TRINITY_DN61076_c0_g1_i1:43-1875(+)
MITLAYYGEQFDKPASAIELAGQDHFEVLGVDKAASDKQIKTSYRKLALKWHPDKNPGCTDCKNRMESISKAYEVLSDPQQKAAFVANVQKFPEISSETQEIDEDFYAEHVLGSENPWLIQVYADWSYGSSKMSQVWERTANTFEGAVNMGRVDFSKNRIFADRIMGGATGLPYIFSVFRNQTAVLTVQHGIVPTRAGLAATVLEAYSTSVHLSPPQHPGCRSHRPTITLVANPGSTARFFLHTLKHKFEQDCYLYAVPPSHPFAQGQVEASWDKPFMMLHQPCEARSTAILRGPFVNPQAVLTTLTRQCLPRGLPPVLSAQNARELCASGCVGSADFESSRRLREALVQEQEEAVRAVYVDTAEQPSVGRWLLNQTATFGLVSAQGKLRVTLKPTAQSVTEFVRMVAEGEGEWEQLELEPRVLEAESLAEYGRRVAVSWISSPKVAVVGILGFVVIGLWLVLTIAQRMSHVGGIDKNLLRGLIQHWMQLSEQRPPKRVREALAKKREQTSFEKCLQARTQATTKVPEDVQRIFDCFLGEGNENITPCGLLRVSKQCGVEIDDDEAEEMVECVGVAARGQVTSLEFLAMVDTPLEKNESDSDQEESGDDY